MFRNLSILFIVTLAMLAISFPEIQAEHRLQDKITQELIDFLLRTGGELIQETEKFLHEIRRSIGEIRELHILEQLIIDFEMLLIELRNQSLSDLSESDRLREVHRIGESLVKQEDEITEEIARIEKLKPPTTEPPTEAPTSKQTKAPTTILPTKTPTTKQTNVPTTEQPTEAPTTKQTEAPTTEKPTEAPTTKQTVLHETDPTRDLTLLAELVKRIQDLLHCR